VLDQAKLASLARLDAGDGFLAQVIDEFLADAAGLVARIEAAARPATPGVPRRGARARSQLR
jgi:hypothetical protein